MGEAVIVFEVVFFGVLLTLLGGLLVWILVAGTGDVLRPNPRPEGEPTPPVRRTRFGWEAKSTPRGWNQPSYEFGVTAAAARRRVLRRVRRLEELDAKIDRDHADQDRGFARGDS